MAPLQGSPRAEQAEPAARVAMPLARLPGPADTGRPPDVARPLGEGPPPAEDAPPDPRTIALVRLDFMLGPVWRVREVDAMLTTSVEIGQMHGLSGTFHTSLIVVTADRVPDGIEAFDIPIGVGAIARGKLRNRPLFGSVGASAGVLVHRANTERGVVHRVDPDFRIPIRLAWTAKVVGLSVAVVQGYSVRNRIYERRGNVMLQRHAYRVGLLIGLHFDMLPGWPMKPLRRR